MCVYGYVVMPEHVHLLISEPERGTLTLAIQSLKEGVARRLGATGERLVLAGPLLRLQRLV
jgi:REP element-mobilizing transposase RayT